MHGRVRPRAAAVLLAVSALLAVVSPAPALAAEEAPAEVEVPADQVPSYDAQGYECDKRLLRPIYDCTQLSRSTDEHKGLNPAQVGFFVSIGWSCGLDTCLNPAFVEDGTLRVPPSRVAEMDAAGYKCDELWGFSKDYNCVPLRLTAENLTSLSPEQIAFLQGKGWSCTDSSRTCVNPDYDQFDDRQQDGVERSYETFNLENPIDHPETGLAALEANGWVCTPATSGPFDSNYFCERRRTAVATAIRSEEGGLTIIGREDASLYRNSGWDCQEKAGEPGSYLCTPGAEQIRAYEAAAAIPACAELAQFQGPYSPEVQACVNAASGYQPHTHLPAWRWRYRTDLLINTTFFNAAILGPINTLANLLFLVASFIWALLLFLIRYGTTLNVLVGNPSDPSYVSPATQVNEGFMALAGALQSSGVWLLLLLFAVFLIGRSLARGASVRGLTMIAASLLPLATLYALGLLVSSPNTPLDPENRLPVGTPGWIGVTGVDMIDGIGGAIAGGIADMATGGSGPATSACNAYRNRLVEMEGESNAAGKGMSDPDTGAMSLVSRMWETSFLTSWTSAQYGSPAGGGDLYCFDLEARLGVGGVVQADILASATGGKVVLSENAFLDVEPESDEDRERLFMFAVCGIDTETDDPEQVVFLRPGWGALTGVDEAGCDAWLADGASAGNMARWGGPGELRRARDFAVANASESERDAIEDAYHTVRAFWGHNSGQRVLEGLVALITALVYLYALGGVAVGAILAQYGLFIMLVLLPFTLLALAIPSEGSGRGRLGSRMLRITAGFFFAKMALTLVMALLVVTATVLQNLVPDRVGGSLGAGSMLSLASAFVPLVSLLLVRKLLSAMGLGDITKLSGAVGMSAMAAAAASGDRRFQSKMSGAMANSRAGRLMDRYDRRMKDAGQKYAADKWNRASGAAKSAWAASDTRGRLDPLLGRKDADGNVIVPSARQRVSANVAAKRAQATAKALGWLTGHDSDGNAGKGNRFQNAMGRSKVARQAYQDYNKRSMEGAQAVSQMKNAYASSQELTRSLRGATRDERRERHQQWVDGMLEKSTEAHLAAAGLDKDSGLYNVDERGGMAVASLNAWGVNNMAAAAGSLLTSEEGGRPTMIAPGGRRQADGSVTGRFESSGLSPREAVGAARHCPEMFLPPEVQKRRAGENESEHHARLMATSIACGLRSADGTPVDLISMAGLSDQRAEAEMAKALRGESSAIDLIAPKVDARAMSAVDAAMVTRRARASTGETSAELKLEQLESVNAEVEGLGNSAQAVETSMTALITAVDSGLSPEETLARLDTLAASCSALTEAAGLAAVDNLVYSQDLSGSDKNLAEVMLQAPLVQEKFTRQGSDIALRLEQVKESVGQLRASEERVSSFETDIGNLKQQLASTSDDQGRAQLQAEIASRKEELEAERKQADSLRSSIIKGQLTPMAKNEINAVKRAVGDVRQDWKETSSKASIDYSAKAASAARTGAPKPPPPNRYRFQRPSPFK